MVGEQQGERDKEQERRERERKPGRERQSFLTPVIPRLAARLALSSVL